jgi:hypothetical protein
MLTKKQFASLRAGDQVKYQGKTYIVKKTTRSGYVHVWDREHHYYYSEYPISIPASALTIPAMREVYNIRDLDFTPNEEGHICSYVPKGQCMNAYCVYCGGTVNVEGKEDS